TRLVDKLHTQGATGELTADEALRDLLRGTGLTYKYLDDKTVTIIPPERASSAKPSTQQAPREIRSEWDEGSAQTADGRRQQEARSSSFWDRFRVAQVDQGSAASGGGPVAPAKAGESVKLEEIVVSAQKKIERLQDVPVPVSVIDTQALADNN